MDEDERVDAAITRAELRDRRLRARRADAEVDQSVDDDATRIVSRRPAATSADDIDDNTRVVRRDDANGNADDDDDDQTRLFFRPRPDATDGLSGGDQPDPDDLDRTALASRRRQDDDVTLRSPRGLSEPDDTWQRGAEPRRDTFTGEPTQSASASIPGVIEAPRRRGALADGEQEPPARVANVPAVIDVMDVYPPRPPEDPLAAHIALEESTRGPAMVIDGASVLVDQRRRARRRLAGLITTIVVVWVAAAAGLAALVLL